MSNAEFECFWQLKSFTGLPWLDIRDYCYQQKNRKLYLNELHSRTIKPF
jgi:hypothetical protein